MSHSESWALRLVRAAPSPRELLQRRRYRTPVFLRLFLDHVEEVRFRDPREGLELAKVALQLARLVPEAGDEEGRREHIENLVRAHTVLAGAYRVTGREAAAESQYELASEIARSEVLSPIAEADLNLRLATLGRRDCQTRRDGAAKALELIAAAEAAYRTVGDQRRIAEAHSVRGYILNEAKRFSEAIPCHGKALSLALSLQRAISDDPAEVAALARIVESAQTNLAYAVSESPDCGFAASALAYINAAQRELKGRRRSLTRHLLQWIEGRVYVKLRLVQRAGRRFKTARKGFIRLEVPWEIALVSLDLASLYRTGEQWELLDTLAVDTFGRFRELCGDYEAIAALSMWVDAVEARQGVSAAIGKAREKVEARRSRA